LDSFQFDRFSVVW